MDFIVFVKNVGAVRRKVVELMYIVDTNVLMSLNTFDGIIDKLKKIYIPVEVLNELDKHKTAEGLKGFQARRAIRNINQNIDKLNFLNKTQEFYHSFNKNTTYIDDIIISYFQDYNYTLVTNDIGMKIKAEALGIQCINYYENKILPQCCAELTVDETADMSIFDNGTFVPCDLKDGQYVIIRNLEHEVIKIYKYLGEGLYDNLGMDGIGNYLFQVKALDEYQMCAIDSLYKDSMSVIVGPAGTGKTLLSIAYCLQKIREGAKVHIFVNPVKTRGSEELGFYPGDRDDKLLQNFIGSILKNKIGDITEVERLIQEGHLNLYPFSDIRGVEIQKGDIMYITEAQNLSIDLMKLAIQRCAEGSKIIIEGDPQTQVDKEAFANDGNGLRRVIEVFTGEENFSYVYLPNIYRSRIAEIAEKL